jgi:Holliday junction resolvasome RuvABC endonuclease subunit
MAYIQASQLAITIANILKVPVSQLTTKMITTMQKSKLPTRFKKLLQGTTKGETRIKPSIMSSRTVAGQEVKAGAKALTLAEAARYVVAGAKNLEANKRKVSPIQKPMGFSTAAKNKETASTVKKTLARVKKEKPKGDTVTKSLRPKTRPSKIVRNALRPRARPKKK